ncbi:hypothetical protein BOX15_Mlig028206g1, partial [Macrostomum lignano]
LRGNPAPIPAESIGQGFVAKRTIGMSSVFLEKIPLPDFSTYVLSSLTLLGAAVYHVQRRYLDLALQARLLVGMLLLLVSADSGQRLRSQVVEHRHRELVCPAVGAKFGVCPAASNANLTYRLLVNATSESLFDEVVTALNEEPWCFWTVINTIYCLLVLLGKTIQNTVFGELRVMEQDHIRDKFWNFVFYKFIFIFGILNVQSLYQVLLWSGWYSILGFLHLLTHLTKDRLDYLMNAAVSKPPLKIRIKMLTLLACVLSVCACLSGLSVYIGLHTSAHFMLFMLAELAMLAASTGHVCVRFLHHLTRQDSASNAPSSSPLRSSFSYHIDLGFDCAAMLLDGCHNLHMLLWSNFTLSIANLVIFMQLRYLYYQLCDRWYRHLRYRLVHCLISSVCSPYTVTDSSSQQEPELCPICWDPLAAGSSRLPCRHAFHSDCLGLWLEQELACPTCRRPVSTPEMASGAAATAASTTSSAETSNGATAGSSISNGAAASSASTAAQAASTVVASSSLSTATATAASAATVSSASMTSSSSATSQRRHRDKSMEARLREQADAVRQIFPHVSSLAIVEDLRISGSPDATIANILEGRVVGSAGPHVPHGPQDFFSDDFGSNSGDQYDGGLSGLEQRRRMLARAARREYFNSAASSAR